MWTLRYQYTWKTPKQKKSLNTSKAPVNVDSSVIEIKTAIHTSLKAKRNYIFARSCNEK